MTSIELVSAQEVPDEREITVSFADIPLDSALLVLSAASNVAIYWDTDIIPPKKRVSLVANYLKLGLALDNVFVGTDLRYRIVGNQLILEKKIQPIIKKYVTVSGRLIDEIGEQLVYAAVFSDDYVYNTISNDYGFYSFTLPSNQKYTINYSSVGYEKRSVPFTLSRDTTIDVTLKSNNLLNEVVVVGEIPKRPTLSEQYDDIPIHLLSSMASLAGEPDVVRMVQMRAGVTPQADGFGGLQVRGGSADQNLVLMDGVPVYNTGHALGLFSIFNPSVVKSANLIKGGIPARYGGRLSSVLDVRVKEGNNQKIMGDVSISPLMARASLEGPIAKGKSSFLISGRRTIVDPWLKPLSKYELERRDETGQVNFYFYDINAKLNFQIGERDQIFISGYMGRDKYNNEVLGSVESNRGDIFQEFNRDNLDWGNEIATIRWTHEYSRKVFGTGALSYTHFGFDNFDFERLVINPQGNSPVLSYNAKLFASDIRDQIGSYDLSWYASKGYVMRAGVSYTRHQLTPGSSYLSTSDDLLDENNDLTVEKIKSINTFEEIGGSELRGYIENELKFGRNVVFNLGAHYSSIGTGSSTYTSLQPRASAKIDLGNKASIRLGYSRMDQYFHLLSSSGLGLPSDVWLPSTDVLQPEQSEQLSASITSRLGKGWEFTIGAYDKTFTQVTGLVTGGPFDINTEIDWEREIPTGDGASRGLEFEISKEQGRIKGWANYTYASSTRTFTELNNGNSFRANADRRHMINISLLGQINDNIEVTTAWVYGSSAPTTAPSRFIPLMVNDQTVYIPLYNGVNNQELPTYHRLDFGVNFYNELNWGRQRFSFGAYNTYGNKNPFYVDLVQDIDGGAPRREQISIIPFLPYVSIGVSF